MNFGARYRHLPYRVAFELVLKRSRAEFGGIIAKYLPGVKRIETEGRICLELKDETNTKTEGAILQWALKFHSTDITTVNIFIQNKKNCF